MDEPLNRLGLGDTLEQIETGIQANTPAGRQAALYGIRSLLQRLAGVLWLDERETYTELPGQGAGGHLQVGAGFPKNTLSAYIHQHTEGATAGGFLRQELARIEGSVRGLYDLCSEGHDDEVTQQDAELAMVSAYVLLGELARRTDLVPIERYE